MRSSLFGFLRIFTWKRSGSNGLRPPLKALCSAPKRTGLLLVLKALHDLERDRRKHPQRDGLLFRSGLALPVLAWFWRKLGEHLNDQIIRIARLGRLLRGPQVDTGALAFETDVFQGDAWGGSFKAKEKARSLGCRGPMIRSVVLPPSGMLTGPGI